jgi:hypothetical protein
VSRDRTPHRNWKERRSRHQIDRRAEGGERIVSHGVPSSGPPKAAKKKNSEESCSAHTTEILDDGGTGRPRIVYFLGIRYEETSVRQDTLLCSGYT